MNPMPSAESAPSPHPATLRAADGSATPHRAKQASGPQPALGGAAVPLRDAAPDATARARPLPMPGLHNGRYPERRDDEPRAVRPAQQADYLPRLAAVRTHLERYAALGDDAFARRRGEVQCELAHSALGAAALERALAYAADAARRTLSLAPYDHQLIAALALLDNRLVELATGEGKSLATALAAAVGALAGLPVQVLTANDYLVARDAAEFTPLYRRLGLSVACVIAGQESATRRHAYGHAITYVTARELAFDYLRDRLHHGTGHSPLQQRALSLAEPGAEPALLRGLCMVIADEADSILVDEALMPLVLSQSGDGAAQRALAWQAWALSDALREGRDFAPAGPARVELTPAGALHLEQLAARLQSTWKNRRHREETICTALVARHLLQRDRDYVVADGERGPEVQIVDARDGRIAVGRRWSRGLHALVSLKESCPLEPEAQTLAQITFQRFFRRCIRLSGTSGTLAEARRELAVVYGLPVLKLDPRLPSRQQTLPTRCFADSDARHAALVERVYELRRQGRPVLIGTDSVAASHALSAALRRAGIDHALLNALNDRDEARLVAEAGRAARVTVSTQMAGRGTHITLDAQALAAGGLHVVNCQLNASPRHDRQLAGRSARQGQPGSNETWLALDAARFDADALGRSLRRAARLRLRGGEVRLPGAALAALQHALQRADETRAVRQRARMLRADGAQQDRLSFCDPRDRT